MEVIMKTVVDIADVQKKENKKDDYKVIFFFISNIIKKFVLPFVLNYL